MVIIGFMCMTTKFAEATLGVKYRVFDSEGKVRGGPVMYLRRGLQERGLANFGRALAVIFAILCVGGSIGGGNMFQINQACQQFINVTGGDASFFDDRRWLFGLIVAVIVGLVIIGGIVRIASVTSRFVPAMTILYVLGCLTVLGVHVAEIPATFGLIFTSAFSGDAVAGGIIGSILIGIQRAVFSNEAGTGSAPIAHSPVKTKYPASEGLVALLEPFVDTVIICTMTALVVIVTGDYTGEYGSGIEMTSHSFGTVVEWFPHVLSLAVILFAFSTMITWSYYGLQSWTFLFGTGKIADISYKLLFCALIVVGAAMTLDQVVDFSDAMLLGMAFPNLIGVFLLLPVVRRELKSYLSYTREVDAKAKQEAEQG